MNTRPQDEEAKMGPFHKYQNLFVGSFLGPITWWYKIFTSSLYVTGEPWVWAAGLSFPVSESSCKKLKVAVPFDIVTKLGYLMRFEHFYLTVCITITTGSWPWSFVISPLYQYQYHFFSSCLLLECQRPIDVGHRSERIYLRLLLFSNQTEFHGNSHD